MLVKSFVNIVSKLHVNKNGKNYYHLITNISVGRPSDRSGCNLCGNEHNLTLNIITITFKQCLSNMAWQQLCAKTIQKYSFLYCILKNRLL